MTYKELLEQTQALTDQQNKLKDQYIKQETSFRKGDIVSTEIEFYYRDEESKFVTDKIMSFDVTQRGIFAKIAGCHESVHIDNLTLISKA